MTATSPGPLAEEAARLVEAVAEWARTTAGDVSAMTGGGGAECQLCPVCQLLALVRRTQPETFAHLADASASMIAALRTLVDHHDHHDHHDHAGSGGGGVERIDLDDREPFDDGDDASAADGGSGKATT